MGEVAVIAHGDAQHANGVGEEHEPHSEGAHLRKEDQEARQVQPDKGQYSGAIDGPISVGLGAGGASMRVKPRDDGREALGLGRC